jgi:hypothetical protein
MLINDASITGSLIVNASEQIAKAVRGVNASEVALLKDIKSLIGN